MAKEVKFAFDEAPSMENFNEKFSKIVEQLTPEGVGAAPAGYGEGTKQDGEKGAFYRSGGAVGWYRIATAKYSTATAIVTLSHGWSSGGSSDVVLLVSVLAPVRCLKCEGASTANPSLINNARLVKTVNGYALDVHHTKAAYNTWGIDVMNTALNNSNPADGSFHLQTPTFVAADETLPDGETLRFPMEWQNPPMLAGVEYRTTERYQGKPVYVKAISIGALPAGSDMSNRVTISSGTSNVAAIVDYRLVATNGDNFMVLPHQFLTDESQCWVYGVSQDTGSPKFYICAKQDMSAFTGVLTLKYTKTTD